MEQNKEIRRPNVVIILTDDQGYGDFGCHGNETIHTPQIDQLYEESLHLTDFHMAPSCAPARAGLMTGRYHNRGCVWHTIGGRSILHPEEKTMGDYFRAAGYHTAVFGKWHLGDNYPYRAVDRGFDRAVIHRGGGIGQTPDYWGNDYYQNVFDDNTVPRRYEGYCTDVFFRLAMEYMEAHRDEPFLIYLAPNAPHYPLRAPEKYVEPYQGKMPDSRARCYAMLTNIDDNVGILRERMEALGLADDTILIYASDNGGEFGLTMGEDQFVIEGHNDGMRGMKCSPYEGGHRVPCFLRYPNGQLAEKREITACTSNMDLLPTLLELCGAQNPDTLRMEKNAPFDGRSLAGLLRGEELPPRTLVVDSQRVFTPVKYKDSAVMYDKWRLINGKELYNLSSDFEQRKDLSKEFPAMAARLKEFYDLWWEDVSRRFHCRIPIHIGAPQETTVYLSSHDWRGSETESVWNQGEVRRGVYRNSSWELFAERDGRYRLELRRWPREAELGICEGIEGSLADANDWYTGGKALRITRAAIRLERESKQLVQAEKAVAAGTKAVLFDVWLDRGDIDLQTWFYDTEGQSLGAYYVYVTYLGE